MAKINFAGALSAVLVHEGGWADHPKDPGGATMKGVTLATYRQYRPGATKQQLRNISSDELLLIYRDGYWNKLRGDDLPAGVDLAVFDFAVNSGPARAAIYLQNIVGTAPDGKIGPLTIKAVNAYCAKFGAAQLVNELCSQRLAFLERLSTWPTFGKGWSRRVAEVRKQSIAMAAAAPAGGASVAPAPKPSPIPTSGLPEPAKPAGIKPATVIVAIVILAALAAAFFFVRF
jgi:lysozyme family protein